MPTTSASLVRGVFRAMALVAIGATGAAIGCKDYLTVANPNVISSDALDPKRDATTLSLSARENFNLAAGWMADFSSFLVWDRGRPRPFPSTTSSGCDPL